MATGNISEHDPLMDSVTCSICMDVLDDPRSLPCMHCYCRKCIQDVIDKQQDKNTLACPTCRDLCPIPRQEATGLKVNFFANSVLDAIKDRSMSQSSTQYCDICLQEDEKVPAILRCIECNEKLCKACGRAHKLSRLTKLHQLLELTGDMSQDTKIAIDMLSKRTMYCQEHTNEPLKYFCKEDDCLICQDCFAFDHQGHALEKIEQTAKTNMKNLHSVIDLGRQRSDKYEVGIHSAHNRKQAIEKYMEACTSKLEEDERRVYAKVDAHFKALKEDINIEGNAAIKNTVAHLAELQFNKDAIDGTVKQLQAIQDHGHPADVVHMIPEMNSKREAWSAPPDLDYRPLAKTEIKQSEINEGNIILASVTTELESIGVKKHKIMNDFGNLIVLTSDEIVITTRKKVVFYDPNLNPKRKISIQEGWKGVTRGNGGCIAFFWIKTDETPEVKIYGRHGDLEKQFVISGIKQPGDFAINNLDELLMIEGGARICRVDTKSGKVTAKSKKDERLFRGICCMATNSNNDIIMTNSKCIVGIRLNGSDVTKLFEYSPDGDEPDLFLCIDSKDNIAVIDKSTYEVRLLSPEGVHIKDLITPNTDGCFVVATKGNSSGDLVALAAHNFGNYEGRVCVFTLKYRSQWGDLL
ncbi:unnamed protein product [Owenia fusiformis]|uniref:Uncharacterized protein n=1 Tax=Owenia fusiformis TaxID=6347 RepID=A0A8S4QC06_OWEFU|nr:unnamed protein product [Owenia fusiformis]